MINLIADSSAVIDVTAPPYSVDNTGRTDCTEQLCRVFDDIVERDRRAFTATRAKLDAMADPNARISFEIRKTDGLLNVIFPEDIPPARIVYFPDGTYLVGGTISYSFDDLQNIVGGGKKRHELNRGIHMLGESREGVVIRLRDRCAGFELGARKPVVSFMQGESSNIAMTNTVENMTIDVGCGNPGAVGLVFMANNTGAVRNVSLVSSDPGRRGHAGLALIHEKISGVLVSRVSVTGFDYGVVVSPVRNYVVLEHITVRGQRRAGLSLANTSITVHDLYSENAVPAVTLSGASAHLTLIGGRLIGRFSHSHAIECEMGALFARSIVTQGYEGAISYYGDQGVEGPDVDEYSSHGTFRVVGTGEARSLQLAVEETPEPPDSFTNRARVGDFGVACDGKTDDGEAIQAAMDSGAGVVVFEPGTYLINRPITIPSGVQRVLGMYANMVAGPKLQADDRAGLFTIVEDSPCPLWIEDFFTWERFCGRMRFIHHASRRTLVMSDLHTQTAAQYFNSVPGARVYIENCASTIGGDPYRDVPCFHFVGQQVWARQLNAERSLREVVNEGGTLWVLGFKTEDEGIAFETTNGGRTEILGGILNVGKNSPFPAVLVVDSDATVVASTIGYTRDQIFPVAVREVRGGTTYDLTSARLPTRYLSQYVIPLCVASRI